MILHFYMAFPLCIPEQFAKLQLLYQLLGTYSLKMQWEQRPCGLCSVRPEHVAASPIRVAGVAELCR